MPPSPTPPTILIHDHTLTPPTTTHYLSPAIDHTLAFAPTYLHIKSLLTHPACAHAPLWPCAPCDSAFAERFWSSAALLLDYFADFYAHDTGIMREVWWGLVDTWQESLACFWPVADVLANPSVTPEDVRAWMKARWLVKNVKDTIRLMDTVIHGPSNKNPNRETIIHDPSGDGDGVMGRYNTGPWISGLKPWEQFLCRGGPGVAEDERAGDDACFVPLPGINILKTHTSRGRALAGILTPDTDAIRAFDDRSLKFPTEVGVEERVPNGTLRYHLSDGAPPIVRHRGYADVGRRREGVGLWVLDDFVATCRMIRPFYSVSGGGDDGDGEEEGELEPFDVWVVREGKGEGGKV